jgi:hypothetical protein
MKNFYIIKTEENEYLIKEKGQFISGKDLDYSLIYRFGTLEEAKRTRDLSYPNCKVVRMIAIEEILETSDQY